MNYEKEVKRIVANCLEMPVDSFDSGADMSEISEWDSMRNVMILSQLEDYFDIVFPEDDIFDLTSVRALAEEIEKIKGL